MRSGGYNLHQSLTLEAASIVKQSLNLAKRRGHAQVTPLHVANAMLSSPNGLLKRACLQSHSHPLQCKALELCFNVALNRLPTSASSPLLSPHSHIPSLSNALVAAFKRAQAHQRRGSIENQQQPILALKVEIEQLVISILDDPSVSRVMREAGFSSTQVKANVEKVVSLDKSCSSQSKDFSNKTLVLGNRAALSKAIPSHQFRLSLSKTIQNDDVMSVLEAMMKKKTKNTVILSENSAYSESLIKAVIEKFDKKEVPSDMKFVQFISVPLFTLRNISKEEFEVRVQELRSHVKSYANRGIVLYLGDLDWVSEFWSKYGEQRDHGYYYSPVEYMIMELSRLISGEGEISKRIWLMGIATFQTYAKCKSGRPCLETLWSLHPLTIPSGSLSLGLSLDSGMNDQVIKKEPVDDFKLLFEEAGIKKQLICCSDCSVNFKKEAQAVMSGKKEFTTSSSTSSLPIWLQKYKNENRTQVNLDQECDKMKDLCKKWNSICTSIHKKPHFLEKVFNLSSQSHSSSTSTSSNGHKKSKIHLNWPVIFEPNHVLHDNDNEVSKPNLSKPELLSNPNSSPNSASSSEASQELDFPHKFKDFNQDNLNILSNVLENKVPSQKDIIPDIVTTILKCRSRTKRQESWLCFLGFDHDGKQRIARELAKTIFGSYNDFVSIGLSNFSSSTKDDQTDQEISTCNKRAREEHGGSVCGRFFDAVRDNPSRLFYVDDLDQMDCSSLKGFKRAIKDGSFRVCDDEDVLMNDAIVIFSCQNMEKFEKKQENGDDLEGKKRENCGFLDLNISTENDHEDSVCGSGILDLVDKKVVFKIQVL